jgi:uncharacterized membrane protein
VGYLLALTSAAAYGAGDFIGGIVARRANAIAATLLSQLAGLVVLVAVLPALPSAAPARPDFIWGAVAGLAGGIGVALLYRALAVGVMAVVAPITAVCAVTIPVMFSLVLGERPPATVLVGIGVALVAIVLVSQESRDSATNSARASAGVSLALLSGVAIGLFFLALARTSAEAGLWPLVAARSLSVVFFTIVALAGGSSLRLGKPTLVLAAGGGVLDMLANVLYLLATRYGSLSVIVTLSSLYPASTVVLARVFLGERMNARQTAGIACAFVAVVLIVRG